jgi:UDP-glucuronate 4-epimerase
VHAPYRLFNIGHGQQASVNELIELLEGALGIEASRQHLPARAVDVPVTQADISDLHACTGFVPQTPLEVGIKSFAEWFLDYHGR